MKNINVKLQCQEFGSYLVLVVLAIFLHYMPKYIVMLGWE